MALENLQDQLREQFTEKLHQIQDSAFYNNIRERYETLTPTAQKGIIAGSIAVIILILISIPYSYFSNSSDQVAEFETDRGMLRELLKAGQLAKDLTVGVTFADIESIKSSIMNDLGNRALQSEQIGGINILPEAAMGRNLAPAPVTQTGLGVTLKNLNLKQIVDIGFALQNLNPTVKLGGVEINATKADPHYFDVLYKLAIFSQPGMDVGGSSEPGNGDSDTRPKASGGEPQESDE